MKRPGRVAGKGVFKVYAEQCSQGSRSEPDSLMGPLVRIRIDGDPRMNLAIPWGSDLFAELFKQRPATERINSFTKSKGSMARGVTVGST